MLRFVFLFLSLGCSYSFAETNYRKELENFAQTLVFDKYNELYQLDEKDTLQLKVVPLDKRITYPVCETGIKGSIVAGKIKKNTSVKLTCNDEKNWTTYLRVKVAVMSPTVVTRNSLSKGQVLSEANISIRYIDKSLMRNGGFTASESLYGTRLKRNLSANRAIRNRDICFVCKDDKVTIHAIKSGLSIKASGIALNDANIGGTVRVKNTRTQRVVVGTVYGLKKVIVSF